MEWRLDGEGPIWAQMVENVKRGIVTGAYGPGERLPAVREMALEAGVNPNTAQRALTELERQGLVYAQRTAGRFVTGDAGTIERLRRELADGKVRAFLEDMEALGYSREEILSLIRDPRDVSGGERHEA